jgi:hypothetical protein
MYHRPRTAVLARAAPLRGYTPSVHGCGPVHGLGRAGVAGRRAFVSVYELRNGQFSPSAVQRWRGLSVLQLEHPGDYRRDAERDGGPAEHEQCRAHPQAPTRSDAGKGATTAAMEMASTRWALVPKVVSMMCSAVRSAEYR